MISWQIARFLREKKETEKYRSAKLCRKQKSKESRDFESALFVLKRWGQTAILFLKNYQKHLTDQ
jgi:hypothetical protein